MPNYESTRPPVTDCRRDIEPVVNEVSAEDLKKLQQAMIPERTT